MGEDEVFKVMIRVRVRVRVRVFKVMKSGDP